MKRTPIAILLLITAGALPGLAAADSPLETEPGPTVALATQAGLDVDPALDFEGGHPMLAVGLGYRFATGTEPFATASLGAGGHEAAFLSWGLGVRQRLDLGRLEPFLEAGIAQVADNAQGPIALFAGAGLDFPVARRWSIGIAAGHYVSDDNVTGGYGALDWYARAHITFRLGR